MSDAPTLTDFFCQRLDEMDAKLDQLLHRQTTKDWYTPAEAAAFLGKAEITVREWCRLGRVAARKQGSGRGKYRGWVIAQQELDRLQKDGLLPGKN